MTTVELVPGIVENEYIQVVYARFIHTGGFGLSPYLYIHLVKGVEAKIKRNRLALRHAVFHCLKILSETG